jgi:hypothetical protein
METVQEVMKELKQAAKTNVTEKITTIRFVGGDVKCFRQGDLYVFRVPEDFPVGDRVHRKQIADGMSLGARHILRGRFKVYEGVKPPVRLPELHMRAKALGYAFDIEDGGVLTHPEHDHFKFTRGGRFQVTHQIDLRTLRRVAD